MLSNNFLKTIEDFAFKDLISLEYLNLKNNSYTRLCFFSM